MQNRVLTLPVTAGAATPWQVPLGVAPKRFAEPSCGKRDRRKGPGGRRLDEELASVHEVGGDGTPRIDTTTRTVLVHETNHQVTNAVSETPNGKGQSTVRVLAQGFGRIAAFSTHFELDWHFHQFISFLLWSHPNESTPGRHPQHAARGQTPERLLAGRSIDRPQPLRLSQGDAQARHLVVLGLHLIHQLANACVRRGQCNRLNPRHDSRSHRTSSLNAMWS
jgi:hypothetical protein